MGTYLHDGFSASSGSGLSPHSGLELIEADLGVGRVSVISVPTFVTQYALKPVRKCPLVQWEMQLESRGVRYVVFETNGQSSLSAAHSEQLGNQFVVFPGQADRYNLGMVLETVDAFLFWYNLDKKDNLIVFNSENFNQLSVCACLSAIGIERPMEVISDCFEAGITWTPNDDRFLHYIARLLRSAELTPGSTGLVSFRPRCIMIKQMLLDKCWFVQSVSSSDLCVWVNDMSGVYFQNEFEVQYSDEETGSLAIHFPKMKSFPLNESVCISLGSRSKERVIGRFWFNTGFVDNLTSSVITTAGADWDWGVSEDVVLPAVLGNFRVQIVTVPAGLSPGQKIHSPYSVSVKRGKSVFCERHTVLPNEQLIEHFKRAPGAVGFDNNDIAIALKIFQNKYLDATMFLYKHFHDHVSKYYMDDAPRTLVVNSPRSAGNFSSRTSSGRLAPLDRLGDSSGLMRSSRFRLGSSGDVSSSSSSFDPKPQPNGSPGSSSPLAAALKARWGIRANRGNSDEFFSAASSAGSGSSSLKSRIEQGASHYDLSPVHQRRKVRLARRDAKSDLDSKLDRNEKLDRPAKSEPEKAKGGDAMVDARKTPISSVDVRPTLVSSSAGDDLPRETVTPRAPALASVGSDEARREPTPVSVGANPGGKESTVSGSVDGTDRIVGARSKPRLVRESAFIMSSGSQDEPGHIMDARRDPILVSSGVGNHEPPVEVEQLSTTKRESNVIISSGSHEEPVKREPVLVTSGVGADSPPRVVEAKRTTTLVSSNAGDDEPRSEIQEVRKPTQMSSGAGDDSFAEPRQDAVPKPAFITSGSGDDEPRVDDDADEPPRSIGETTTGRRDTATVSSGEELGFQDRPNPQKFSDFEPVGDIPSDEPITHKPNLTGPSDELIPRKSNITDVYYADRTDIGTQNISEWFVSPEHPRNPPAADRGSQSADSSEPDMDTSYSTVIHSPKKRVGNAMGFSLGDVLLSPDSLLNYPVEGSLAVPPLPPVWSGRIVSEGDVTPPGVMPGSQQAQVEGSLDRLAGTDEKKTVGKVHAPPLPFRAETGVFLPLIAEGMTYLAVPRGVGKIDGEMSVGPSLPSVGVPGPSVAVPLPLGKAVMAPPLPGGKAGMAPPLPGGKLGIGGPGFAGKVGPGLAPPIPGLPPPTVPDDVGGDMAPPVSGKAGPPPMPGKAGPGFTPPVPGKAGPGFAPPVPGKAVSAPSLPSSGSISLSVTAVVKKGAAPSLPGSGSSPTIRSVKISAAPLPFTSSNAAPYAAKKIAAAPAPVETSLPLGRRLHWKPLRNVDSDTIWASMDSEGLMAGLDVMKEVFEGAGGDKKSSSLPRKSPPIGGAPENTKISLLEAKRAQNIGVVMARVPDTVTDALEGLIACKDLNTETLERIRSILPTEEETNCFLQFDGKEIDKLRDIERKIFALFRLPRLAFRIRFCLVTLQLPALCADVRNDIGTVRNCASEIRASEKLKKLLHLVLQMGNYVNFGGMAGGIRGFSIESLGKLMEFKSASDSSISTLHFLAARMINSEPELMNVYADLPSLKLASRIPTEGIVQSLQTVRKDPEAIRAEIHTHAIAYSASSLAVMKAFLDQLEPMVGTIVSDWSECEKELVTVRRFFGEDPKKISADEFFNHLRNFLDNLAQTCADLKKRPKKFEKIINSLAKPDQPAIKAPASPKLSPKMAPETSPKLAPKIMVMPHADKSPRKFSRLMVPEEEPEIEPALLESKLCEDEPTESDSVIDAPNFPSI